jgi:hypothetical protein
MAKLSNRMSLYLSYYFDYGLNTVTSASTNPIYQPDGTYNGVLASNQAKAVKPIAFGLKLGICWQMSENP